MAAGDCVHIPALLTGAGEFEGLRWAGELVGAGRRELLLGDVESPVFPRQIADSIPPGSTLRQRYEPALEKVLGLQGFSLADLGGAAEAEAFWAAMRPGLA